MSPEEELLKRLYERQFTTRYREGHEEKILHNKATKVAKTDPLNF